jgi:hypothetical protein
MVIREKDGMIAVYRNLDLMMNAIYPNAFMMNADFVIFLSADDPRIGKVIKDRHGIFSQNSSPVKKVLEIITFLYENEKAEQNLA